MHLEQPWALLLLAGAAVLIWRRVRGNGDAAVPVSSAAPVRDIEPSLRVRLAEAPYWLRVAALCLLILALAQPQTGGRRVREPGRGLAIEMVLDRSGSMKSPIWYRGRQTTRLAVAQQVATEFLKGDGDKLKGRGSDMAGLVTFALRPETVCPLTLSHDAFAGLISHIPFAGEDENRTAIGDALALAAARLRNAEADRVAGKAIILLTDGENNAGVRNVWQAAQLAAAWGIRVHAIGIVGSEPEPAGLNYRYQTETRYASARDLQQLAGMCGGVYRSASDGEALKSIYAEIDRLEKTEIAATRYTGGTDAFTPFAVLAAVLLALSALSESTWLRRLP